MTTARLTKEQREAWMAIGEAVRGFYTRANDSSLPDDVALDPSWVKRQMREMRRLVNRWIKTLPRVSAKTKKVRGQMIVELLPLMIAEASGPGSKASTTFEGRTLSAEASEVPDEEPN